MSKMRKEILKFNKLIYSRPYVVSAIRAFKKVAVFNLCENKEYYVVEISKSHPSIETVVKDEFRNYVLGAM